MVTEDYVSFEVAEILKEKGFDDEYVNIWYDERGETFFEHHYNISSNWRTRHGEEIYPCPTLQMAMKWLREVHHIFIDITSRFSRNADNDVCFSYRCKKFIDKSESEDGEWLCYEEACEAAIEYCLKNLI